MEPNDTKEATLNILNKKNTVIVEEFIKTATQKMYDQQIEINQLKSNISTLVEKMAELENRLAAWKGQTIGHGPSVK
jgi:hypothetical protein